MSLPRSIDRADLQGQPVTLTTTAETVVLVGPQLQTPKDTSIVVAQAALTLGTGAAATAVVFRIRQGAGVGGPVVGQPFTYGGLTSPVSISGGIMASLAANFTDYVQLTLTAQQTAATGNGTVTAATMLVTSF